MKILLITQYFWPEDFGAGVWILEMAKWLVEHDHQVTVVTGFPNHPEGRTFSEYRGLLFQREQYHGVRVIRTWLYATPRTNGLLRRILSQASFGATLLFGGLAAPHADVVAYFSPPLPGALTSWLVSRWHRAVFVLNVQDIEPERSVTLGLFRNRLVIWLLEWLERFVYRHADRIAVLSPGMRDRLARKGVPIRKFCVTPNWADGSLITPLPGFRSLRSELGLDGQFVVLYSGNMGYTTDLETVIEAARLLRTEPNISFLLVGDGVKGPAIQEQAAGLSNVRFLPLQPRGRLPSVLATADVALVPVCREGTHVSVPGKTYSIMAAAKPVLAICDLANDTVRVVREAACGSHVEPGDAEMLARMICTYLEDPQRVTEEGRRARAYFETHFTIDVCVRKYEQMLVELLRNSQNEAK